MKLDLKMGIIIFPECGKEIFRKSINKEYAGQSLMENRKKRLLDCLHMPQIMKIKMKYPVNPEKGKSNLYN